MQFTKIKKDGMRSLATQNAVSPKISLFYKLQTLKACFSFFLSLVLILTPYTTHAGFFSSMGTSIGNFFGANASAETPKTPEVIHNSQTVPLLEPNLSTDLKNVDNSAIVTIVGDQALESTAGPNGTEANLYAGAYTSDSKIGVHIVQKGQTLASIAKITGVSTYAIIYANSDIKRSDLTKPGTILTIIPLEGVAYTVKKGENASLIAKKYGLSVNDILEYNVISKASDIDAGETIFLVGTTKAEIEKANKLAVEAEKQAKLAKQAKTKKVVVEDIKIAEPVKVVKVPEVVAPPVQIVESTAPVVSNGELDQGPSGKIANGFIWPFPEGLGRVTQKLHGSNGIDFGAKTGTPIYAVADGFILIADKSGWNGGYGLFVTENFKDGSQGMYAHMSKVVAVQGAEVKQGDLIGYVGNTGKSTGPHLHFERRGGPNPYNGLAKSSTSEDFHD